LSLALAALGVYVIVLNQAGKVARSRLLAARAMEKVEIDPRLATQLALEAKGFFPTQEAESSLRLALSGFQESRELTGHQGEVYTAQFSPNGELVVTASLDKTARIWDAQTLRVVRVLTGHDGRV